MDNMTAKSHISLVITSSRMMVMIRRCGQSLRMRYIGTLLGTLKHHVVMNASKVLLHKSVRRIGLTCWYILCNRNLQIRSWDSCLKGSIIINVSYFTAISSANSGQRSWIFLVNMGRRAYTTLKKADDKTSLVDMKLKFSNFVSNLPVSDMEPSSK